MRIVSIGAGNLATHLSKALQSAGFDIVQVFSRTEASAKSLSNELNVPYTTEISCIVEDASLYIIAVSDDAIEPLSDGLRLSNGLIVHCSGSVPMDSFSGKFENYGVFYPLQTFSKTRPLDFAEIPVFLEANSSENLKILRSVAEKLSRKVYEASSEERKKLHLAAVFACNFVNHLYHLSSKIAQQAGFDFDILSTLIRETTDKAIFSGNPKCAQTGPAVRNDGNVLRKHMELLSHRPELQEIYSILSENILRVKNEA